jgi:hypothetical protein
MCAVLLTLSSSPSAAAPLRSADLEHAAADLNCLPCNQGFSDNVSGSGQYPAVSLAGYLHQICRCLLIQTFNVTETDGLEFFQR